VRSDSAHRLKRLISLKVLVMTLTVSSCGRNFPADQGRLRDDTSRGTMGLESDGTKSFVLVHLPQDHEAVALCIQDKNSCIKSETPLLPLSRTSAGFWRSVSPVSLSHGLEMHVVNTTANMREILLSVRIQAKSSLNQDENLPPEPNLPKMRPVPGAAIAYDFQNILSRDSKTAAVVRMVIQGGPMSGAQKIKIAGNLVNLRDSSKVQAIAREVTVMDGGVIDFTIAGLAPETVYRLERVTMQIQDGSGTAGNAIKVYDDFYTATVSDSDLSKAKRRALIRALSEAYDWDHNNYNRNLGYASGSWCDRFYTWVIGFDFKAGQNWGSKYFFQQHNALGDSRRIPELAQSESLAADLIRYEGTSQGTHTFMIIAYDVAKKSLWTVEGNFNARVMRYQRYVGSPWMHGHFVASQVRP
jgi:hypothetical protein